MPACFPFTGSRHEDSNERHGRAVAGAFVSLVFDAVHDVGPSAKLTLLALADRANRRGGGQTWPSLRDIAERTDREERTVRTDLRVLEERAWIKRIGTGLGGRGKATTYQLSIERMLLSMPLKKAASHIRELRKLPGALLPGFTWEPVLVNPAVSNTNPEVEGRNPDVSDTKTRTYSAPEPEVEPEFITGSEPARAQAQTANGAAMPFSQVPHRFNKQKGEPEGRQRGNAASESSEAEIERRLREQLAAIERMKRAGVG